MYAHLRKLSTSIHECYSFLNGCERMVSGGKRVLFGGAGFWRMRSHVSKLPVCSLPTSRQESRK